jgi:hypothetical protein
MPAGNQGQGRRNEGRERHNGGARQPAQSYTQNLQEGVEQVSDRVREGYDSTRDEMARHYREAEGAIARHPGGAVLVGFGIGFGIGLAVTALLTRREETWAERYMPDSIRSMRVPESVREAHLPESIHHSFHHLALAIRDLPSSIARLIPGR